MSTSHLTRRFFHSSTEVTCRAANRLQAPCFRGNESLLHPARRIQTSPIRSTFILASRVRSAAFCLPQTRAFSSKNGNSFKLDALSFSVSPDESLAQFQKWAHNDQGLKYLLRWSSVRIGASYVPVWSFDINIRYVLSEGTTKRYDWKPTIFSIYGNQKIIHVPGLSAYAGHEYRRSLINPVHNTTLVFMGDKTQPFGNWMLRDMELSNGALLQVVPDPWNTTKARAFQVIQDDLEAIANAEAPGQVQVQTEVVKGRRVYMPTYVIDYSILGMEYRAFVSGCDAGAGVSGVSHQVWSGYAPKENLQSAHSFLSNATNLAQMGARVLGPRGVGAALTILLQFIGNVAVRLLARIPIIAAVGGVFVGFRKIIQPWMDNRSAHADWEHQRQRESMEAFVQKTDDFFDNGSARSYYQNNQSRILKHLSGEYEHEQGDYDFYKSWESWARQQWEQEQQKHGGRQQTYGEQQSSQQGQQQQRQQRKSQQARKPEFHWDFDPNDPYSVLGVRQGASKSELSAAFRREMLKHHPDVQAGVSEAEKERAIERSKIITGAYQQLKKQMK
jgi:DnaJ-domain-containing protein 1